MALNINMKQLQNKNLFIKLSGDLDINSCSEFKEQVFHNLNDQSKDLYIDASSLAYIDSTGLGSLIGIYKRVKEAGNAIYIENLKPNVKKIFMITDLDKIFHIKE